MRNMFFNLFTTIVLLLSILSLPSFAQMEDAPAEVANASSEWPLAHYDYHNTRATTNSGINTDTVSNLNVAWTVPITGQGQFGAAASAPIISNGVVYLQDLASNVYAIDLESGESLWKKEYDNPVTGPNGPAIGYGKIFVASGVGSFAAIDLETGEEVWSVQTPDKQPTGAIQPYVYDDKLFITTQAGVAGEEGSGIRGYEAGRSGHIYALNPETGETIWHFQTVEEDFWGNPDVNSGGGVWFSPIVDADRNLTIWGTGNPAPFPGTVDFPNGSSIEGPALYSNSVIALDMDSGELEWYNHINPNDLFDLDVQISPMLVETTIDDESRQLIIGSGKLGEVIAIDPDSGEEIWRIAVGRHYNDNLTTIPEDMTIPVWPGTLGGVETPMAYADDVIYAPVLNLKANYNATAFGAENGSEALANTAGTQEIGTGTSELVAIHASTGIVLWVHDFDAENYGGATVINDLVVSATADGVIHALNRETGEEVWSWQAPAGINAWPAVAGDTIVWPAGFGEEPSLVALSLNAVDDQMQDSSDAESSDENQIMQNEEIYKQSPWWPYLSAHMNVESPPDVVGGPIQLHITQTSGGANWVFPGPRELDTTIFGTEDNPLATEVPPIALGAPMGLRQIQDDGSFITNQPTPFGDNFASTRGTLDLMVVDATATDGATTKDAIEMVMTFQAPGEDGGTYRIEMTQVAPHGWFIPTAGGVATNIMLHGITRWGTQLMPTQFAYVAFWGPGTIYLNDEVIAENRMVHGMLTEFVREEPYDLVFDENVNPNARHFHIIVPAFTNKGVPNPVPTGFELPNGMEQPFFHVMLSNVGVTEIGDADLSNDSSSDEMQQMSAEQEPDEGQGVDQEIDVVARNFAFEPGTEEPITVTVGQKVRFNVESTDVFHTFTIKRTEDAESDLFNIEVFADESSSGVWTPSEPGTYYIYCKPHEGLGMTGTIEVVAS